MAGLVYKYQFMENEVKVKISLRGFQRSDHNPFAN